jgi:hypothetical protein
MLGLVWKEADMRKKLLFVGIAAIFLFAIAAVGKRPDKEAKVPHLDRVPQEEIYRSQTLTKSYIPPQINYQGYLTDVWGSPINDTLDMAFQIYEAQPLVPVQNGLFNVLLGRVSPIPPDVFIDPNRWLQTEIDGQTLSPRKQIVSVGYSFGSVFSDEASFALTADSAWFSFFSPRSESAAHAGVADLANHALYADLAGHYDIRPPVILIDSLPLAVLEVTNTGPGDGIFVGNVGADAVKVDTAGDDGLFVGYAWGDGIDVAAAGAGVYVFQADLDGIYVDTAGDDGLYADWVGGDGIDVAADVHGAYVYEAGYDGFHVRHAETCGVYVGDAWCGAWVDSAYNAPGFYVRRADWQGMYVDNAVAYGFVANNVGFGGLAVVNAGWDGVYVESAGWNGFSVWNADYYGVHVNHAESCGVYVGDACCGVWVDSAYCGSGFNVRKATWDGVHVDSVGDDGVQVTNAGWGLYVENAEWSGVWVVGAGTHGVLAYGDLAGGRFFADTTYAVGVIAHAWQDSAENTAIYAFGKGLATGGWSAALKNGKEGFSIVSSNRQIMTSGTGRISNGKAKIRFDPTFTENLASDAEVKIILTPSDIPSGLICATKKSRDGFEAKVLPIEELKAYESNLSFDWIAIGELRDYETTPEAKAEWQMAEMELKEKQRRHEEDVTEKRFRMKERQRKPEIEEALKRARVEGERMPERKNMEERRIQERKSMGESREHRREKMQEKEKIRDVGAR